MKIQNFLKVQLFVYFYLFVYFSLETTLLRAAGLLENFPSCFSFALGGRIIAETPFKCPGGRDAGI